MKKILLTFLMAITLLGSTPNLAYGLSYIPGGGGLQQGKSFDEAQKSPTERAVIDKVVNPSSETTTTPDPIIHSCNLFFSPIPCFQQWTGVILALPATIILQM